MITIYTLNVSYISMMYLSFHKILASTNSMNAFLNDWKVDRLNGSHAAPSPVNPINCFSCICELVREADIFWSFWSSDPIKFRQSQANIRILLSPFKYMNINFSILYVTVALFNN